MINIDERIKLYSEIYGKTYQIASKANPDNARYVASEIFKEVARDLRSELISELRKENEKTIKTEDTGKANGVEESNETNNQRSESKEGNGKPATDKQRQALHKFGIERVPENLGIKEAGEILNTLICHLRERDQEAIADLVEKFNKEWV